MLAARNVVERARDMAGMLNGMIATRADNLRMKEAVIALKKSPLTTGEFESGMTVNPYLLYGGLQHLSPSVLTEDERERVRGMQEKARAQSVPVYLLALQHLTDDSDNR
jgi:hypothetical protein